MKKYHNGDEITVTVDRVGLSAGEGIGHLPDDTMVVMPGADQYVGQTVNAVISTMLETSLGDSVMAYVKQ